MITVARADLAGFMACAAGSVVLHAALLFALVVRPALPRAEVEPTDTWAGDATETTVEVLSDPGPATPAPVAPPSPIATAAPEAIAPKAPTPIDPDGDVAPKPAPKPRPAASVIARPVAPPSPTSLPAKPATDANGAGKDAAPASTAGTFGADATPSLRNLGYAFTRAIAPANQADAGWTKVATGELGPIDVEIEVDADGHVEEPRILTKNPPAQLRELLRRTVAGLGRNVFVLRGGDVAPGSQLLRIGATVTQETDDVQGGDSKVGFTFARGKGKAPFAQPGGRHVVVSVEIVRVTVR